MALSEGVSGSSGGEGLHGYIKARRSENCKIIANNMIGSLANCICYTFSAVVIKFIAEVDLWIAICVQATTNFFGCYVAMLVCEKWLHKEERK